MGGTPRRCVQTLILYGIPVIGVHCVFAAPNCALWGNMTVNMSRELLNTRRDKERPAPFLINSSGMAYWWRYRISLG